MTYARQVIVGGSAAGVSAALAMRQAGFEGSVVIVDGDVNLPYERPPLSKSLLAGRDSELRPIVAPERYRDEAIDLILGTGVVRLDAERRRIELSDGQFLPADHVVLATGVAARRLPIPGANLRHVLVLRDAKDARQIASRLDNSGEPLVIVGGGFIGLELAAAATQRGIDVTVVEYAPLPLLSVAGHAIARLIHRLHDDRGVKFVFDNTVAELYGTDAVEAALLRDGTVLPATTVVVGVGVVPRQELAAAAGVKVDAAGIVVDRSGETSVPWISATGDVASQEHPDLRVRGRIEHWNAALKHGAAVGASTVGVPTAFKDVLYAWSDQFDLTYQMFGRPHPGDELVLRAGATPQRFIGFWLRDGRVRCAMGVGASREIGAARRLIESGAVVPRNVLEDQSVDLRGALKGIASNSA